MIEQNNTGFKNAKFLNIILQKCINISIKGSFLCHTSHYYTSNWPYILLFLKTCYLNGSTAFIVNSASTSRRLNGYASNRGKAFIYRVKFSSIFQFLFKRLPQTVYI